MTKNSVGFQLVGKRMVLDGVEVTFASSVVEAAQLCRERFSVLEQIGDEKVNDGFYRMMRSVVCVMAAQAGALEQGVFSAVGITESAWMRYIGAPLDEMMRRQRPVKARSVEVNARQSQHG